MTSPSKGQQTSPFMPGIRNSFRFGLASLAVFGGTLGLWAAASPMAGAVVAPGSFVVDTNLKKVQHQTGGIVAHLAVKEGDRVKAGDLLVRLDETVTKANLQIILSQLDQLRARQARLEAERDGKAAISFPDDLTRRSATSAEIAESIQAESRLLQSRLSQREGQRAQLNKRIEQLRQEITGIESQAKAREDQIRFLERELVGVRDLFAKKLVPITRIMPLEREAANMAGQRGQLLAGKSQAEGKIAETELQLLQLLIDLQTEVGRELREVQAKTVELLERRVAAEDQLTRVEMRAPIDGYVHQLNIHTVGGVISPAEPAMQIVPFNEDLQIEARVQATDIDQLFIGQRAVVKVQAGNQRTTPEIVGTVSRIGADITREQQTGLTYFVVRITTAPEERARLGDLKIVSGMQAETYMQTAERTPFQYLVKPLTDQYQRAFRER
jgi:HlyD family secretion protein